MLFPISIQMVNNVWELMFANSLLSERHASIYYHFNDALSRQHKDNLGALIDWALII